ncbi:carbamate kinase [Proteus sp. DFP240708]|uniref:Carbamate kinase n=2 Tax=Proteus TaxID=583 RepID=A0A6I7D745_9GAMM|nr:MULTISPECIES: carbamate kinase [Proteus]MBG2711724.1 carbamate kinase [Proteus mirabilis]MBG2768591.1 carbamate kinase [Proteus mirabilis]MBG2803050.1 carbamate kinase [Proteus mirabilis]MBG3020895.1 carbamate kinase [Proteus mirabilis]MBG3152602.1 carbamate kinase [Proteus mirabilis]
MKTIVIALGGNALLQRGEVLSAENQYKNIELMSETINKLAKEYRVVLVHGNGPQVGLLALQNLAYQDVPAYPLDILVAESQGMIGYMMMQKINQNHPEQAITTVMTRVSVDINDEAFNDPSKFIGPIYDEAAKEELIAKYQWTFKQDGKYYRRVVPSPTPKKIIDIEAVRLLLDKGHIVICGGGGGIPVNNSNNEFIGSEAVIDKDLTAALISRELNAEHFVILTEADAIYKNWGTPEQAAIREATPEELAPMAVADGAMGPKIMAVSDFVNATGQQAHIGALQNIQQVIEGQSGTLIYQS